MRLFIEHSFSMFACCLSILTITMATQNLSEFLPFEIQNHLILFPSIGASTVILFFMPQSKSAQPWAFCAGQFLSALIGISYAQYAPNWIENSVQFDSALVIILSIFVMLCLRCLHPPAVATALSLMNTRVDYISVFFPLVVNIIVLLTMAIFLNRWCFRRHYPL